MNKQNSPSRSKTLRIQPYVKYFDQNLPLGKKSMILFQQIMNWYTLVNSPLVLIDYNVPFL